MSEILDYENLMCREIVATLPSDELVPYDTNAFYESIIWIVGIAIVTIGAVVFLREKVKDYMEGEKQ